MKVLVIGSGGREHAMAWKLLQSSRVQNLVMVPENQAAIAQLQKQFSSKQIQAWPDAIRGEEAMKALARKAKDQGIEFAVVGPDNALADGAVDIFESLGIPSFGPSKEAARLESSKIFSKKIMQASGVPTAEGYEVYSPGEAKTVLQSLDWTKKQWVIKADGLALGKGVEICETLPQALEALTRLNQYSDSFVIEERLHGKEISWLAFCDGDNCALLAPARDYKTLNEDPLSPNTGGMGAVCPVPNINKSLAEKVRTKVFEPVLKEMKNRGTPYKGILYAGLMVNQDQVWVLEFNSRFGDPEAQALLPLMDEDLLSWCEASQAGKLSTKAPVVPMKPLVAVYVVAAAPGYPGQPFLGKNIQGVDHWITHHQGFFAGVKKGPQGEWLTAGGRVLGALGLGASVAEARLNAFKNLKGISFEGMQYREGVGEEWV